MGKADPEAQYGRAERQTEAAQDALVRECCCLHKIQLEQRRGWTRSRRGARRSGPLLDGWAGALAATQGIPSAKAGIKPGLLY